MDMLDITQGETFRYTTRKDRTTQEIKLGKHQEVLVINQANLGYFLGKTNYHLFKKHWMNHYTRCE